MRLDITWDEITWSWIQHKVRYNIDLYNKIDWI